MAFSDVPFGDGPFVGREVPERYIKEYFSKHGLGGLLVLGTTVEDVSVLRDGEGRARERWRLTLRRFEGGRGVDVWWQEEFDAVFGERALFRSFCKTLSLDFPRRGEGKHSHG